MRIYDIQTAFARGELSPRLHGRTDIDHYRMGLKECTNWYVLRQGALRKRPGTEFIAEVRDSNASTRLVPFTFSTEQSYMLEFGDNYFRVLANGATITEGAKAISGATQANPVVVTATAHGFANGDKVLITGVAGMTELNDLEFTVSNQATNTFELSGTNGTGFGAYLSGGTAVKVMTGATQANPVVVTVTGHGFSNGDRVLITGVGGMAELNNREFTVANKAIDTFELSGIDGTGFTAYTSGGTALKILEVAAPYPTADLFDLKFAQSADTLYVAHPKHAPRKITRTSDTAWTVTEISFLDGPFLPEPDAEANNATFTLDKSGNPIPDMTSNTLPSGTVIFSNAVQPGWHAFDRDDNTGWTSNGPQWIGYDPPTPDIVVNGYYLQAVSTAPQSQPSDWTFDGFDGTDWVVLDRVSSETAWSPREWRYFDFKNKTAYQKYRLNIKAMESAATVALTQMLFKEDPDTVGGASEGVKLTASSTIGINDGQGFLTTDVGRQIRLQGSDAQWRWYEITSLTNDKEVLGKLYGAPLLDLSPIRTWRMGAWSAETGYPASVSFFEERLIWARTDSEPQKVWGSKTFGFEDHGVSSPLLDDDAFSIELASDQVNEVKWISESSDLVIGTSNAIRTLGPSDTSKAFSATNVRQRRHTTVGSAALQPARIGSVTLYADHFAKSLRELLFSFENNAFAASELTILSDHLLASGITGLAYAEAPESMLWMVVANGDLVSLTFERDQRIFGMARHAIAGGAADGQGSVESIATIPGAQVSEVWMVVRRTIGGATKRYVERLGAPFEAMAIEDAAFLDGYLKYDGAPATVVTGLHHLEGETVGILADGIVEPDHTVLNGRITLAGGGSASKIVVGLKYASKTVQLRPTLSTQDGSHLGRLKSVPEVFIDLQETLALKVGPEGAETELLDRAAGEPMDQQVPLRSGSFKLHFPGGWRGGAELSILSEQPLPATIRTITRGLEIEP